MLLMPQPSMPSGATDGGGSGGGGRVSSSPATTTASHLLALASTAACCSLDGRPRKNGPICRAGIALGRLEAARDEPTDYPALQ